jgi:hypothetical protein
MSKNIALILAGRTKDSWKNGFPSIYKYLVSKLRPVIFVSTYSNDFDYDDFKSMAKAYGLPFTPEQFNIETFVPNYHKIYQNNDIIKRALYYRNASMFFHISRAFSLLENYSKEHNINFDYVIRCKCDLVLYRELTDEFFNNEAIIIPRNYNEIGRGSQTLDSNSVPDVFVVGSLKMMSVFCKIFDNLEEYYDKYSIDLDMIEQIIGRHLYIDDIKVSFTKDCFPWTYSPIYDKTTPNYKDVQNERDRGIAIREIEFVKKIL